MHTLCSSRKAYVRLCPAAAGALDGDLLTDTALARTMLYPWPCWTPKLRGI